MKKITTMLLTALTWLLLTLPCYAQEAEQVALGTFLIEGYTTAKELPQLTDGVRSSGYRFTKETNELTLSPAGKVGGLYFIWNVYPEGGYGYVTESSVPATQNSGFFQEYLPLPSPTDGLIILNIPPGAVLCEIYALGEGELPGWVHAWQPPCARADILVLPTHADDEHLYFGGVLPTYAPDPEWAVQVAYMTSHAGEPYRQQELLDGLWEVGVRSYPVISPFPDLYSDSLAHAKTIYSEREVLDFQRSLLERFRPQVVFAHDLKGEYGHGAHMLNAETMIQAVKQSEFAPKKLYLHLYPEREILLEVNAPLPAMEGKTAFSLSEEGFAKHRSQQQYFRVEQKGPYDMRKFGLYYTSVGEDSGNDPLEHVISYRQQEFQQAQQEIVENFPPPPAAEKERYLPEAQNDSMVAWIGSPVVFAVGAVLLGLLLASVLLVPFVRRAKRK